MPRMQPRRRVAIISSSSLFAPEPRKDSISAAAGKPITDPLSRLRCPASATRFELGITLPWSFHRNLAATWACACRFPLHRSGDRLRPQPKLAQLYVEPGRCHGDAPFPVAALSYAGRRQVRAGESVLRTLCEAAVVCAATSARFDLSMIDPAMWPTRFIYQQTGKRMECAFRSACH